ncbi:MAG TPA: hypothetical protein VD968_00435 [Pyrinomonadaceae bacterium]|nr:hypothetical protein [Pyrinomonadaceae bacterium]
MKALLTTIALCALAAAQSGAAAGGVEVVGFDWKYDGYLPVETVRNSKSATSTRVRRGTDYVFKYRAQATVKNAGAKAVKAVEWDFVFSEAEGGRELKRYKLRSKQQVRPGATALLSEDVFIKPEESTRHISDGRRSVSVTRVEFSDGSEWRAEGKR